MNHEVKKEETNIAETQRQYVEKILDQVPVDELLGSVTTYPEGNDKTLRSSARVFKKIKLDANSNSNPTNVIEKLPDKKEEIKIEQTPKKLKFSWSTEDRILFFEALNEYGKDFENIHSYIVQKLKKKGVPENLLITKEHVRHLYYKTWHKISKYLKFSEGTKKTVQELYGLINYGELRKKIGMFTQKINHKLNEMIYHGYVAVRVKGKMVKVKTPLCPALRRINKLDDKDEELKLPSRVVVELRPKDMNTFLKVQKMAFNPRIRTVLPLQKKLNTLITCVSKKWKSAESEYIKSAFPLEEIVDCELREKFELETTQLKFTPPKDAKINIPETNISEIYTRESVCLKAYEERMGIESSKYFLTLAEKKEGKKSTKSRNDSFNETTTTKSPIKSDLQEEKFEIEKENTFEIKETEDVVSAETGDEQVDEALKNFFSTINETTNLEFPKSSKLKKEHECLVPGCSKTDSTLDNNKNISIKNEEQIMRLEKIRNGWTVNDCDNLTIGELYLMFGSASKIVLEYHWIEKQTENLEETDKIDNDSLMKNFNYTSALRKLVSIFQLNQKKPISKCPCGHTCSPKNAVPKKNHVKPIVETEEKIGNDETHVEIESSQIPNGGEEHKFEDFVKPQQKPPTVQLMAQLDSIQKLKPKFSVRKGRTITKQLVVERELPLTPEASGAHQIVRMNIISQNSTNEQTVEVNSETDYNKHALNSFENLNFSHENGPTHFSELNNRNGVTLGATSTRLDISDDTEFLHDPTRSLSPSGILKENTNNWMSSEVGDFSLSSFLGHLESPMKSQDDVSHDVDAQVRSLLTENSFDYTAKFADLAKKVMSESGN